MANNEKEQPYIYIVMWLLRWAAALLQKARAAPSDDYRRVFDIAVDKSNKEWGLNHREAARKYAVDMSKHAIAMLETHERLKREGLLIKPQTAENSRALGRLLNWLAERGELDAEFEIKSNKIVDSEGELR